MNADQHDDRSAGATELAWSVVRPQARKPKPKLTRERIVAAAIDIADREGLAGLSMQHLAEQLGAGTMSLYRHVPNKEELIGLALDQAIAPPPVEQLNTGAWRTDLERWARLNLEMFDRHPWTLPLVGTTRMMGPNETAWLEAALAAIADVGLTPAEMLETVLLLNSFVRGTAEQVARPIDGQQSTDGTTRSPSADQLERLGVQDLYPTLLATLTEAAEERDRVATKSAAFDYGLQRILDGIEAHLRSRRRRR